MNMGDERAKVLAADRAWALSSTDLDKFTSFLSSNANFYPPHAPAQRGADAFRRAFGELRKMPGFSLSWTAENAEVASSADIAYSTGTYTATIGGTTDSGKYLTIWRKQADGSWKVIEDMFNSDLPIPTAPNRQ